MVLTGSCPWPRSWSWSYGAHLQLQAREDPNTNGDGGSVHFSPKTRSPWPASEPATQRIEKAEWLGCMDEMTEKQNLRSEARARRAQLTRADFAERIAGFANDLRLSAGVVVAGYHPIRDEADPRLLVSALAARGHALALPCVASAQAALVFRSWKVGDVLMPNAWGIAEPLATAPQVTPAVVLVPLLAFDATGHRLGYGGGYYDRTIAALPGLCSIGIAYAGQEVSAVPREPHDHALDMLVTENGVRRFAR